MTSDIISIYAQKDRLWYLLNQSTVIAYMPVGTISGAITGTLDFGQLFSKGGYLMAMADWTIDGGNGPQDYTTFISSRGQIAIFSGTDPTSSTAWNLVGVFNASPPIGRRCVTQIGSDVAIITIAGVLPISQLLPFDPSADRSVAITTRIQNAMAQATAAGLDNFGWEITTFPAETLLILNVPVSENVTQQQFVMNTLTGAWCQFVGWDSNCFAIFNDLLYWGGKCRDCKSRLCW